MKASMSHAIDVPEGVAGGMSQLLLVDDDPALLHAHLGTLQNSVRTLRF